jgi:hypothetical protein
MGYISQFSRPGYSVTPELSETGKYDIHIKKGDDELTLTWDEQDHLRKIAQSVNKLNIELCGTSQGVNQTQEMAAIAKDANKVKPPATK